MHRWLTTVGTLSLLVLLAPRPAAASERVVGQAELDAALARHAGVEAASRASVERLLERSDVRAMLEGAGLEPRAARAGVALLDGDDLAALADLAQSFDSGLAGGQGAKMGGGTGKYMPLLYGVLVVALVLVLVLT